MSITPNHDFLEVGCIITCQDGKRKGQLRRQEKDFRRYYDERSVSKSRFS